MFLSMPEYMSGDEGAAVASSKYDLASKFVSMTNWAERWQLVEQISYGGRVLWIISHMLWGYVFPTDGSGAFTESTIAMLIAMVALAGAAKRLYGERGMLLAVLLISVSPHFTNYVVRVIGTVQSFAWVCVALYFFTSPKWSLVSWIGGGLAFGMSFTTHYGSGPAILGISVGMGFSLIPFFRRKDMGRTQKIIRGLFVPIFGIAAALLPIVLLEIWARHAGSSFIKRYFEHEVLMNVRDLGTFGMWLRQLFELEPLWEVLFVVAIAFTFISSTISTRRKIGLGIVYCIIILLTISALQPRWIKPLYSILDYPYRWRFDLPALIKTGARESRFVPPLYQPEWDQYVPQPRMWISVALFAVIGIVIAALRIPTWNRLKGTEMGEVITETVPPIAPFSRWSVVPAILISGLIFTGWRQVSGMPRLVFPYWPVLLIGLVGLLLKTMEKYYSATLRIIAFVGIPIFLLGAYGSFQTKASFQRSIVYAQQHTYKRHWFGGPSGQDPTIAGAGAMYFDEGREGRPYIHMTKIGKDKLKIFGPPATLYPASAYEEEVWKPRDMDIDMAKAGMAGWFSGEQLTRAWVFFEQQTPGVKSFPPPNTPLAPKVVKTEGPGGSHPTFKVHPYRGLDFCFPAWDKKDAAEISMTIELPAAPGQEAPFGFEIMALNPLAPPGTIAQLRVSADGQEFLNMPVANFYDERGFQYVERMITPSKNPQQIKFTATLTTTAKPKTDPQAKEEIFCPPYSIYIRRVFIGSIEIPETGLLILDAPEKFPGYAWIGGNTTLLAFTRYSSNLPGMGLFVRTPVWNGDPATPISFAGSFDDSANPRVELGINGRAMLIFDPKPNVVDQSWESNGVRLVYKQLAMGQGCHGVFQLFLPSGASPEGKPVALSFRVIGGGNPQSWFGVRDVQDPASLIIP